MSEIAGSVQVERTVASIRVGNRHRTDLGDLEPLAASITRDGLLQPITVTPDGFLVCGARRLAALKLLHIKTVNVWVRSGLSDRLGQLLAEQDDNVLHKPLNKIEAAALYRELKTLMAEDAAGRQTASRFTPENQPGNDGPGKFPEPSGALGETREQAAAMIPGGSSYRTYDKIGYLEHIATDPTQPEELRAEARAELDQIQSGGPVDPAYMRIRAIATADSEEQREARDRDAELHRMADGALARVKAGNATKQHPRLAPTSETALVRLGVRAFVLTWTDLTSWWEKYDVDQLAAELTDEQADAFYSVVDGTVAFAAKLRTVRSHDISADEDSLESPQKLHAI